MKSPKIPVRESDPAYSKKTEAEKHVSRWPFIIKDEKRVFSHPNARTSPQLKVQALRINVLFNAGGMGDMIARLPALRYFCMTNPHADITVWYPGYMRDVIKTALNDVSNLSFEPLGRYKYERRESDLVYTFNTPQHTTLSTNITRHAFHVLCDEEVPDEYLFYEKLPAGSIPQNFPYIPGDRPYVLLCSNYTAPARRPSNEVLAALAMYCLSNNIDCVLIGNDETKSHHNSYINSQSDWDPPEGVIDIRNKTPNLLDLASLMHRALCLFGTDNGLIHLAAMTDCPIIAHFTTVDPAHREIFRALHTENEPTPWQKIAVLSQPAALECRYCQSHLCSVLKHNWAQDCLYGDFKCRETLTPDTAVKALMQVIELELKGGPWASEKMRSALRVLSRA